MSASTAFEMTFCCGVATLGADRAQQTLALPDARSWLRDRAVVPDEVGLGLVVCTGRLAMTKP